MTYDIVLFTDGEGRFYHAKTLGAYRIATELRKHGYSVKVVDWFSKWLASPQDFDKLINLTVGSNTLFIGFSSTFFGEVDTTVWNINCWRDYDSLVIKQPWPQLRGDTLKNRVQVMLQEVKKKFPNVKFVYGGNSNYSQVIDDVDFIVKGLADTTVVELADHLKNNTGLKYIPSGKKAKIIDYDTRAASFDFKHSQTIFTESDHVLDQEPLPLETSRGCLFKCSFCDYPLIGRKKGDPDYHKNVESLANEFKYNYQNSKTTRYAFVDDTFNETTSKIIDVLRARDLSGVDIEFSCYLRADLLAKFPEQIDLLKQLGMSATFLGIESFHPPSAKSIGKSTHPDEIRQVLHKLKEQDIRIAAGFIIGLPDDNYETLETWVPWVLQQDNPIDFPRFQTLNLNHEGSEMNRYPEKFGYRIDPVTKEWTNQFWSRTQAFKYTQSLMQQAWETGRLRLGGWDSIYYQQYPLLYHRFKDVSYDKFDYTELHKHMITRWESYRDILYSYEEQCNSKCS
jgi:radical SAM superfamily enzyme YgiQ (UPF0313 family)